MKDALIIMMKNPIKGKVKTRLAKDVGDDKALEIYIKLLEHTKNIAIECNVDRFVFYSDIVDRNDFFELDKFKKYTQCSGNLGVRMDYAFSIPFKNAYKKVVMIGADCITLKSEHIQEAFDALTVHDFAIGPAKDGGYYLLGMKQWNRWITENKNWSTSTIFEETQSEIRNKNGKLFLLETLTDIDTKEDLLANNLKF